MQLYKIHQELNNALENVQVDIETGEVLESSLQALEALEMSLQEKQENIAKLVLSFESYNKNIQDEIKRLKTLEAQHKNKIAFLEKYLMQSLEVQGATKLQTATVEVHIRNNPPSVLVCNEDLLHNDYKEFVLVTKINKNKIKNDIKQGLSVAGAELVNTKSIKIK
jgi:hypothetical protein